MENKDMLFRNVKCGVVSPHDCFVLAVSAISCKSNISFNSIDL